MLFGGPPTRSKFRSFLFRNMCFESVQIIIGVGQLVYGIVLLDDEACNTSGIVNASVGGLYIIIGMFGLCFWCVGLGVLESARDVPVPKWIDGYIPDVVKTYLRRGTRGVHQELVAPTAAATV